MNEPSQDTSASVTPAPVTPTPMTGSEVANTAAQAAAREAADTEKENTRIEAFSDGVFTIVMTLLVLEIHVPSAEDVEGSSLLAALASQWANYLAFAASFFFILVMWINHNRLFKVIRRNDNNLMLLNGLLLFSITLIPFPTALVAEYLEHPEQRTAVIVYNALFLVTALAFNLLWRYASYNNRLFTPKTDRKLARDITRTYNLGPFLYLGTLLLAFISPALSLLGSIVLAVFFALPNRHITQIIASE